MFIVVDILKCTITFTTTIRAMHIILMVPDLLMHKCKTKAGQEEEKDLERRGFRKKTPCSQEYLSVCKSFIYEKSRLYRKIF